MRRIGMLVGAIAFLSCTFNTTADVLYKDRKPIALGTGTEEKGIIHWVYCDGKKAEFKKPPHKFVTGENCKIEPDSFGIIHRDSGYFVSDPAVFHTFFSDGAKGDQVTFSADQHSVRMDYKGRSVTLDRTGDLKQYNQAKGPQ